MTLAVDQLSLGPIGTNCFVVRAAPDAAEAVVIDPGDEAPQIRRRARALGATCAAILLTHSHYDHFGALADLAEATGRRSGCPRASSTSSGVRRTSSPG